MAAFPRQSRKVGRIGNFFGKEKDYDLRLSGVWFTVGNAIMNASHAPQDTSMPIPFVVAPAILGAMLWLWAMLSRLPY